MDHWVDRPEVQARQRAQPTGTNRPTRTTHTHTHAHPHQRPSAPRRAANQTRVHYAAQNQPTHPHTRGGPATRAAHHTPPPSRRPQRAGKRPDPYRTRKLSPPAPMVLPPPGSGRVGHHRNTHHRPARGRRPNQAPTPTRAKPTNPHPHPYNTTKVIQRAHGVVLLCGPLVLRWTTAVPRSRVRSARLGVRGAAAPGAAVREIAG